MKRLIQTPLKHLKRAGVLRGNKRIITQFADRFGLVYFGFVSQHDDEHRIIRGMTLSTNHRDEHYCIGTYENYDVIFAERSDQLRSKTRKRTAHQWLIMAFDLKTTKELPHIFVGLHSHSEEFYMQFFTKYPTMRQLQLGHTATYPSDFAARHRLYAAPTAALEVEKIITPDVAKMLSEHFNGLAFEIVENTLYVYAERLRVSADLLETMIKNGRWLAESIDQAATIPEAY